MDTLVIYVVMSFGFGLWGFFGYRSLIDFLLFFFFWPVLAIMVLTNPRRLRADWPDGL